MIDKNNFKDLIIYALIVCLFILAFVIIKPVIMALIYGILLAYITHPIYRFIRKKIKNETISAFIVCFGFFIIAIAIILIVIGSLFNQAVGFYTALRDTDLSSAIANALPKSLISPEITNALVGNIKSSISNLIFNLLDRFNQLITQLPILFLKFAVTIFVFFFALRDGEKAIEYLKSVSPLKKEVEEKFLKRFRDITNSVLLGQILVGIIQGTVAGIGFYIFGIDNALFLTLIAVVFSIIPMIGPAIVWVPVLVIMLVTGKSDAAFLFLVYNLFLTSLIDNLVRPLIVSRRTELNTAIIVIGMIGGFLVFGIIGFIIGPLILSYVLLLMEIYRKKDFEIEAK